MSRLAAKSKSYRQANIEKVRAREREKDRKRYYAKRGMKPGDLRVKVYEQAAIDHLQKEFPQAELILGKSIGNDCTETGTHRYPDVLLTLSCFYICVEVDERAHRGAEYSCDWRRMNEVAISLGSPVYFIRYKPDAPDSDLKQLTEKVREITALDPTKIDWVRGQFKAEYLHYSDDDLRLAAERKVLAEA